MIRSKNVNVPGHDYIQMPDFSCVINADKEYHVYLVSSVVTGGTDITINYSIYLDGMCIYGPLYGGGYWFCELGFVRSGSPSNYKTGNQEIMGYWL